MITAAVVMVAGFLGHGGSARAQLGLPPLGSLTFQVDPALRQLLTTAPSSERVEAVVTFYRYPTEIERAPIRALGVQIASLKMLPMVGVRGTSAQISHLVGLPGLSGVRSIYLNRQLSYFLNESVPAIGADRAWNELGITGRGVGIALIDSGIDSTHPDLTFGSKVVQNVKVLPDLFGMGRIFIENLTNADTTSGHGTHVASIAAGTGTALAGKYRGVAVGGNLVGIGAGEVMFMLAGLEAFDWVLANHAAYNIRVISNSWGTTGSWPYSPDDPINVASRTAHDAGMVVTFAAGNEGPDTNTLNPYCVAPWTICVAAGGKDRSTLADFSSRGIPGDSLYHPTITAPGVDIAAARTTAGIFINRFFAVDLVDLGTDAIYYAVASGTSMATPHVSGTVALMLEANPLLTPDQIRSALEETATPMPGYAVHEVGAGFLNAYGAVASALSLRPMSTAAFSR
jgi:serine protease AprX